MPWPLGGLRYAPSRWDSCPHYCCRKRPYSGSVTTLAKQRASSPWLPANADKHPTEDEEPTPVFGRVYRHVHARSGLLVWSGPVDRNRRGPAGQGYKRWAYETTCEVRARPPLYPRKSPHEQFRSSMATPSEPMVWCTGSWASMPLRPSTPSAQRNGC
jgi:hypothetical protein